MRANSHAREFPCAEIRVRVNSRAHEFACVRIRMHAHIACARIRICANSHVHDVTCGRIRMRANSQARIFACHIFACAQIRMHACARLRMRENSHAREFTYAREFVCLRVAIFACMQACTYSHAQFACAVFLCARIRMHVYLDSHAPTLIFARAHIARA